MYVNTATLLECKLEFSLGFTRISAGSAIVHCLHSTSHPRQTLSMTREGSRLFKDLFRHRHLPKPEGRDEHETLAVGSHRSIFRRRSPSLLTPQTSGSSGLWRQLGHLSDTDDSRRKKKRSHHPLRRFFRKLKPELELPAEPTSLGSHVKRELLLAEKYNLGRLIGTGASGTVLVITDKATGKVFAVKKFRARLKLEDETDFGTKIKNEYLIGEFLHHQNLIRTYEMLHADVGSDFYIVMEYCPYDFFNLVMSGLMSTEEAFCYLRQIVHGVHHLHELGIAHRDLKLDNCVVDSQGVLKLIDFGLAFQFKKSNDYVEKDPKIEPPLQHTPLGPDHKLVYAKGIVGSDPYLLPEVFEPGGYDPRLADVWLIAIIYCCMILRRFPWKVPRLQDLLYKSFTDKPDLADEMNGLAVDERKQRTGPARLLRLLPAPLRPLIGKMLEVDPKDRVLIDSVMADPFIQSIDYCHLVEPDTADKVPDTDTVDDFNFTEPHASVLENGAQSYSGPVPTIKEPVPTIKEPDTNEEPVTNEEPEKMSPSSSVSDTLTIAGEHFAKGKHKHHLITEQQLEEINQERERAKRLKETGVA